MYRQKTTTLGVSCDKPSCIETIYTPVSIRDAAPYEQRFQRWLAREGWTVWVSRGQRQYCPNHRPGSSTKMRQVEPR